jgi:transposase
MLKVARLDVISSGARRRWTLDEKQRIVAESYAAPRQVSATARRNGLSASQLFTWRRLARDGRLAEADEEMRFAAAIIGDDNSRCSSPLPPEQPEAAHRSLSPQASATVVPGRIEIVLMRGHRVIVDNGVDAAVLARGSGGAGAAMIAVPSNVRVLLATGHTDMRKGFATLSLQVQEVLRRDPLGGHLSCFRGRSGNLLKVIWHDGQGARLFTKRLERGRFLWPSPADGAVTISPAQLGYLLDGCC